jgi:hypothetical protein
VGELNVMLSEQSWKVKSVDRVWRGQLREAHIMDGTSNNGTHEPRPPKSSCTLSDTRKSIGIGTKAFRAKARKCPPDDRKREFLSPKVENIAVLAQGVGL